ncbi:hypothetical protein A343_1906 [Porphyromonas gingivalis JCVI SC001]|nr:hypothetical protein A343_1906 [Porphyromonas gingivalis JCVI SC001]
MITEEKTREAKKKAFEAYRKQKQIPTHFVDAARIDFQAGWSAALEFLFRELVDDANDQA